MLRPDNQETHKLAAEIISKGGLIAFRTDTFYGLGADPLNAEPVGKITSLKGREEGKPILILIADLSDSDALLLSKPALFDVITKAMWPGPLTLVVPAARQLPVEITAGTGTVGIRLPNDERVRSLVRACGGRLTATSANPSGKPSACSAAVVQQYFPRGVDLIIDGGDVTATKPSTVFDIVRDPPRVVREGAISHAELEQVLDIKLTD